MMIRLIILVLLYCSPAQAVTNLLGWALNDFSGGNNGDKVTWTIISNSFQNNGRTISGGDVRYGTVEAETLWTNTFGHAQMFLTNDAAYPLPVPVNISGTYYPGSSNLGMRVTTTSTTNVAFTIPIAASNACVCCYIRVHMPTGGTSGQKDLMMMVQSGIGGAEIMSIDASPSPDSKYYTHQANPTEFGAKVFFNFGQWYWQCNMVEGPNLNHYVQWYDPSAGYALVGISSEPNISALATTTRSYAGVIKYAGTGSVFDLMVDYSNMVWANIDQFPMIPYNPPPAEPIRNVTGGASLTGKASVN